MKEFKDVDIALYILDAVRECAYFSARRAREKAWDDAVMECSKLVQPGEAGPGCYNLRSLMHDKARFDADDSL